MAFGGIIREAASPTSNPRGIGGDALTIWHCDNEKIYELSTTDLSDIKEAASPGLLPSGIGGDASTIWHCDRNTDKIYELSTTDFNDIREAAVPSADPYGIGGDANTIWHCDYNGERIYELSTSDFGGVIRETASPDAAPGGIGGDADTIWHCEKDGDKLHELSTTDLSVIRQADKPPGSTGGIGGDALTIWYCEFTSDKIYELDAAPPVVAPTVTTQAADPVGSTTATGKGTITDTGRANATKRGIVYNTTGDPTREPTYEATPVVESTTPSNQDGYSTSFVMAMPETRPDGDLYIAWVAKDGSAAFTVVPGNWIEIDVGVNGFELRCGLWYWIGDGEPESYTIEEGSQEWSGAIIRISGQHAVDPINKIAVATIGTDDTAEIPQVTPDCGNPLLLAFAGIDTDFWDTSGQYPDGWDGLFTLKSGSSESGAANAIGASKSGTKDTLSGLGVFDANGEDEWRAIVIAISPVSIPSTDDYEEEEGDFGIGAFTRDLTGLDPETQYFAKAFATNIAGTGHGAQIDFTTSAAAQEYEKALSDTITVGDVLTTKAIGVFKAEAALAITDSPVLVAEFKRTLADDVAIVDTTPSRVVEFRRALADPVTIIDALSKGVEQPQADDIGITDTPSLGVGLFKAESALGITDAISKEIGLYKTEAAIGIVDALALGIGVNKADSLAILDVLAKVSEFVRTHSDSLAITDVITKAVGVAQADGITITDTILKGVGLFKSEVAIGIIDTIAKAIGVSRTDSLAITDAFTKVSEFARSIADTVTISDSIADVVEFFLTIADDIAITEAISKGVEQPQSDLVAIADAISKGVGLTKADSITMSEMLLMVQDTVYTARLHVWTGSEWNKALFKRWTGSDWEEIDTS